MLPHPIKLSENPGAYLRLFIQKRGYTKVAVLTDNNTVTHCYPLLLEYLPKHHLITVESGEAHKTLDSCDTIWTEMSRHFLDRHSVLIVVGGGVLGDMGGFCAATYKRGIDFILMPTTLLAMADASIGGKLAIDFKGFKNHIGLFQEPALNLIHQDFLKTLPEEELRSGFAEVIKHALISDRQLWDEIRSKSIAQQPWEVLLRHSAEFKSSVVAQDPKESGLRKILNVGHTIGHALESLRLDMGNPILHGEAVAFGMVCEAYIAQQQNLLSEAERNEIIEYIRITFGNVIVEDEYKNGIAGLCLQDKKNKDNVIYMALLDGIGKARWDCAVTEDTIVESLTFYQSLQI